MNWGRLGAYLSGLLLAGAVVAAFVPIAFLLVLELYKLQGWLKTDIWSSPQFANWSRMKLPHTSWVGLQRLFDLINSAPGPVVLLCACVGMAILLFFLSRLVAEVARDPGKSY